MDAVSGPDRMGVSVDQTRNDRAAAGIDDAIERRLAKVPLHLIVVTDSCDLALT